MTTFSDYLSGKLDRDDYDAVGGEICVYSAVLARCFYGISVSEAQANRDAAEQVYYRHHAKDFYPVEH